MSCGRRGVGVVDTELAAKETISQTLRFFHQETSTTTDRRAAAAEDTGSSGPVGVCLGGV